MGRSKRGPHYLPRILCIYIIRITGHLIDPRRPLSWALRAVARNRYHVCGEYAAPPMVRSLSFCPVW